MLSPSQKLAVSFGDGPCLTLAGPGSGKTLVLTRRVCSLIKEKKISPENILVITFTKAAALEMKERFDSLMEQSAPVVFGTFHSVFYRMLKEEPAFRGYRLLAGKQKYEILREVAAACRIVAEQEDAFEIMEKEISFIKNSMIFPEEYGEKSFFGQDIQKLLEHYEARKKSYRLMDFDDMLSLTLDLLKKKKEFREKWQNRFSYLLIDEVQDMNRLQYEAIKILAEPENNIFMVGDEDQSIYGFRGANPEIMLRFFQDYPKAQKILLQENFRCGKSIVEASLRLISNNSLRFPKEIVPVSKEKGSVELVEEEDWEQETEGVCQKIEERHKSGVPYHSMGVLFRNHSGGWDLVEQLREKKIPFIMKEKLPNPYGHPVILDLISYLRLSSGMLHRRDLFRVMNAPNRYLARASIKSEWVTFDSWKKFYREQPWIYERIEGLERDIQFMGRLSGSGALMYVRKKIGYDEYLQEKARSKEELEHWLDMADCLQHLAKGTKNIGQLLVKWEKERDFACRLSTKEVLGEEGGVRLFTLHGSKGLEFEEVFILDCNEKNIPSARAETVEQIQEERRLFYVGLTRARKHVYLYYLKEDSDKKNRPSRFLRELQEASKDVYSITSSESSSNNSSKR